MSESTRRGLALLAGAFALGAAGDAWLRIWPWGINAPLWTGALILATAAILLCGGAALPMHTAGRLLIVPTLSFALAIAWRDSPVLIGLNLIAVLVGLTLMALYSRA